MRKKDADEGEPKDSLTLPGSLLKGDLAHSRHSNLCLNDLQGVQLSRVAQSV